MKRILSLVLVCVLLLGVTPVYGYAQDNEAQWQSVCEDYQNAQTEKTPEQAVYNEVSTLDVGDHEFQEREPNNSMGYADRIYSDYTVYGSLSSSDRLDYYVFTVSSRSTVRLVSLATRRNFLIGIMDTSSEVVAAGLDLGYDEGYYVDALEVTLAPGTYYIVPVDSDGRSNDYIFYLEIIPENSHFCVYNPTNVVAPTCVDEGYTVYSCTCGDSYAADYVPATGIHTYVNDQDATCEVCGFTRDIHVHNYVTETHTATCVDSGYVLHTCACGHQYADQYVYATGLHIFSNDQDTTCDVCGYTRELRGQRPVVHMYRMYDPNSGEHFYTGSDIERDNLVAAGWNYEGVGFTFPLTTGDPVHRLYDPVTGEHLYTMDVAEKDALLAAGWNYEGIAFNSGFADEVPQYRLHNPNATRGAYHFTSSLEERDFLISVGWEYQGIGWYSCWK